jgi:hypothetical protein
VDVAAEGSGGVASGAFSRNHWFVSSRTRTLVGVVGGTVIFSWLGEETAEGFVKELLEVNNNEERNK